MVPADSLCKHLQLRTLQLLVGPTFMSLQTPSAPHPSASCWPNFHVSANTFSSAPFSFLLAQLSCLCKHLQLRILQLLVGPTFMSLQTPSAPHPSASCWPNFHVSANTFSSAPFSFLLAQLSCLCKHLQLRILQLLVGPTFMSLHTPSAPHPSASCWPNFHVSANTFSSASFSFLLAQLSCLCTHLQLRTLQLLVGPTFMSLQTPSAPHPSASCWPNFHVSANTFSSAPFSFLLAQLSCLCKHFQLRILQLLVGPTFMSLHTPSAPHPSASCWPNFHVSANTFSSASFSFLLAQLSCLCTHLQLRTLQLLVGPTFMSLQTPSAPHPSASCWPNFHVSANTFSSAPFSFLLAQLSCLCKHLQLCILQLLVGPTFMSLQTPSAPHPSASCWPNFHVSANTFSSAPFSFLLAQLSCLCKHLQLCILKLLVGPTFMAMS